MDRFVVRHKRKLDGGQKLTRDERQHSQEPNTKLRVLDLEGAVLCSKSDSTLSTGVDAHLPRKLDQARANQLQWTRIRKENLSCDYCILYRRKEADCLFQRCEKELQFFDGQLAKVQVYGKWHNIPRKQVSYGDPGITYTFSGITVPAKPWIPVLEEIRERIQEVTGHCFNFALINRYKDGNDHMGEHRDDEKELVQKSPIASLSLGQHRDFVFRHANSRGSSAKRKIDPVKLELGHGSLLMMNYPTNTYWYHSLPVRKKALGPRINMTFRHMKLQRQT